MALFFGRKGAHQRALAGRPVAEESAVQTYGFLDIELFHVGRSHYSVGQAIVYLFHSGCVDPAVVDLNGGRFACQNGKAVITNVTTDLNKDVDLILLDQLANLFRRH